MRFESHGPVPDEPGAVTVIACQMVEIRCFAYPQSVVLSCAGAGDVGVVAEGGCQLGSVIRKHEDAPPGLFRTLAWKARDVPARIACGQELSGPSHAAYLFEVLEGVHRTSPQASNVPRNDALAVCGKLQPTLHPGLSSWWRRSSPVAAALRPTGQAERPKSGDERSPRGDELGRSAACEGTNRAGACEAASPRGPRGAG